MIIPKIDSFITLKSLINQKIMSLNFEELISKIRTSADIELLNALKVSDLQDLAQYLQMEKVSGKKSAIVDQILAKILESKPSPEGVTNTDTPPKDSPPVTSEEKKGKGRTKGKDKDKPSAIEIEEEQVEIPTNQTLADLENQYTAVYTQLQDLLQRKQLLEKQITKIWTKK